MNPAPLTVVLDFDGTITDHDVGDELCDRFAPAKWRDIDAQWLSGELSLPEAQRRMWALARCQRAEALSFAHEVGLVREGLDHFLAAVHARGGVLWLASGGFDFYIEAILGRRIERFAKGCYNRAHFVDGGIQVEFPHEDLACGRCAICKGKVCDLARASAVAQPGVASRVMFIGDGASDRCAIGRADHIYAVRSGLLDRACQERGIAHGTFESFQELTADLDAALR